MRLTVLAALLATFASGIIIFLLRAFPFLLFSKREPPAFINFIEKYIPSMVIASLLVYCLKDVQITAFPFGIPSAAALACTIILHLWKNNAMLSIFGSTAIYMILNYFL
ncbi:MAG: AzlD domain-containing protein [Treponema sp.]|nr:AzlD domain-containing protein [Treponema sp.]